MSTDSVKHRLVVVGGGFGGLWATRSLNRANVDITLVDKRNFHLFQPLLYQVATGALSPADIASPLRGILARQSNVLVKQAEMTGVDLARRQVILGDDHIPYDSLLIATGSDNHYFGNDHWESVAPGLKTVEDALQIRNQIFSRFEQAERESDESERERLMTFVIIGAGPTGVELAGALAEIARITLKGNFRRIDPATARITVLDGSPDILGGYTSDLRHKARVSLAQLGVTVVTDAMVKSVNAGGVIAKVAGETQHIEAATVLWAAGVKPSSVGRMISPDGTLLDRQGRVKVTDQLTVPGHDEVYVIGDLARLDDAKGIPLPGTAPVAMSQGRYVAKRIVAALKNRKTEPYRYINRGTMAVLGRHSAVADLGWARFSGYPAWLLWLFVHLMYLVEYDNRLLVFIQWAWNYFTRNRGARLITNE